MTLSNRNVQKTDIENISKPSLGIPPESRRIKYVLSFKWFGIKALLERTEDTIYNQNIKNDDR